MAQQWSSPPAFALDGSKKYTATIKTSLGEMTAELFVGDAPQTANNFVFLAREGFYEGVIFHRVISGFMVQTGDPTGTGMGGPGYKFRDELSGPQGYTPGTLAKAPGLEPLNAADVADAVAWAVTRPVHVDVDEIVIRPVTQLPQRPGGWIMAMGL